jgi:hypothetical protein
MNLDTRQMVCLFASRDEFGYKLPRPWLAFGSAA